MNEDEIVSWQESLVTTYQEFTAQIISYAPQLIGAIALLLVGWFAAHLLRIVTKKLVGGVDVLFLNVAKTGGIKKDSIIRSYANIISKMVFWVVMIFFIAATANLLGWNLFTRWMNSIIDYLPSLIAGLIIILAGFFIANIVKTGILNTFKNAEFNQGGMVARIAYITILVTAIVVGTEQIGINVNFLTSVLIVIIGVVLAGGALAFSFGAKSFIANIIGAQHVRKHCRIGEYMKIGEFEGTIAEVTQTSIILDTGSGRAVVPAKLFQEQSSRLSSLNNTASNANNANG